MRKRTVPPSGARRVRQPSRTAESEAPEDDSIAEVYRDMLAEAHSTPWRHDARATKRRRVGERTAISHDSLSQPQETPQDAEKTVNKIPQTVYDIDASDESEVDEWEDVELPTTIPVQEPVLPTSESREDDAGLQITLTKPEDDGKEKASSRRKPVSGAEKKWRLDIHKVHLLCLLSHVQLRNSWCNDDEAQRKLKGMLSKNTVRCLNPKADMPQFSRSTTFADGLKQAKEVLTSKDAFRKQAISMEGSRDLGAQLFCAMLRAVNVNARLVCSLQPLPFSGVAKGGLPVKSMKEYIVLSDDNMRASSEGSSKGTLKAQETPPHRMRRLGQPRFSPGPSKSPRAKSIPGMGYKHHTQRAPINTFL
ncbi:DNA repair protein Rhp41 [Coccidioides immitis RMSCC 3703]|uniref:DNA repair protein Rhp41 n=1 Tax=Coccidioides immitis RMSCC 3703 TaxID=454286 RepID=A0A0J8R913_COCIT|nr:DNA repair protein Rhp41 [Coccidioides immitis RMSCC 3703]